MNSKKGGTILWMFVGTVAIMLYIAAMIFIFGSLINIDVGVKNAIENTKAISLFHRLVTSRECLSTGRTGILNKTLLDRADGGGELNSAYLPGMAYWIEVKDLETGDEWKFGYKPTDKKYRDKYKETMILLKYPDNHINRGKISFYTMSEEPVVNLVYGAEKTWVGTEPKIVVPGGKTKIVLKENKVCHGNCVENTSRKLINSKLDVTMKIFDPYEVSYVKYRKVLNGNDKERLRVKTGIGGGGFGGYVLY